MTIVYKDFPHEVADDCASVHCHQHDVDEPDEDAFIYCFECGHVYRTAGELRRAYRRAVWRMLRRGPIKPHRQPWLRGNEFEPSIAEELWRILTVRAKRITFCQLCLHDF